MALDDALHTPPAARLCAVAHTPRAFGYVQWRIRQTFFSELARERREPIFGTSKNSERTRFRNSAYR